LEDRLHGIPPSGELAESQESKPLKHFAPSTPSARQRQLAEGVEFLEENRTFGYLGAPVGGGGCQDDYHLESLTKLGFTAVRQ
jgi:hypothetical protein